MDGLFDFTSLSTVFQSCKSGQWEEDDDNERLSAM